MNRRALVRRPVVPARFFAVTLHETTAPEWSPGFKTARARRRSMRVGITLVSLLLIGLVMVVWLAFLPASAPATDEVFFFEEPPAPSEPPPPRADPSPPPPRETAPVEAPPPQFGLQEEQLSEAGELSVATGNTLMTEADTLVKAPVAALPAAPPLLDQPPRILKGRAPEYPIRALERGVEGSVVVLATLDTLGRVTNVEIEKSGGRDFDPEVTRAVRALVFQPVIRDGRRTPVRVRLPYDFRLE